MNYIILRMNYISIIDNSWPSLKTVYTVTPGTRRNNRCRVREAVIYILRKLHEITGLSHTLSIRHRHVHEGSKTFTRDVKYARLDATCLAAFVVRYQKYARKRNSCTVYTTRDTVTPRGKVLEGAGISLRNDSFLPGT